MSSRGRRSIPFGRTVPSPGSFGSRAAVNSAISLSVASGAMTLTRYSSLTRLACPAASNCRSASPAHRTRRPRAWWSRGRTPLPPWPCDRSPGRAPAPLPLRNEPDDREFAEAVWQNDLCAAVHVSVEAFLRVCLEFARPRPAGDAVRELLDAELPFCGRGLTAAARPSYFFPAQATLDDKTRANTATQTAKRLFNPVLPPRQPAERAGRAISPTGPIAAPPFGGARPASGY